MDNQSKTHSGTLNEDPSRDSETDKTTTMEIDNTGTVTTGHSTEDTLKEPEVNSEVDSDETLSLNSEAVLQLKTQLNAVDEEIDQAFADEKSKIFAVPDMDPELDPSGRIVTWFGQTLVYIPDVNFLTLIKTLPIFPIGGHFQNVIDSRNELSNEKYNNFEKKFSEID